MAGVGQAQDAVFIQVKSPSGWEMLSPWEWNIRQDSLQRKSGPGDVTFFAGFFLDGGVDHQVVWDGIHEYNELLLAELAQHGNIHRARVAARRVNKLKFQCLGFKGSVKRIRLIGVG